MTNSLSAFSSMLLFLENFHGCFGTSSGMARPSLVKLPIKESVVEGILPSASSTILFVLGTT